MGLCEYRAGHRRRLAVADKTDGIVFAPLGHVWIQAMQRIQLNTTLKSKSSSAGAFRTQARADDHQPLAQGWSSTPSFGRHSYAAVSISGQSHVRAKV
jgi:hypothetical protein